MLPYPAETGSVPRRILHSCLKQKKRRKLNSPFGESIFFSTFDISTSGHDKQVDETANTECKKIKYQNVLENRCFSEIYPSAAAVRRAITCCCVGCTDPRSDSVL